MSSKKLAVKSMGSYDQEAMTLVGSHNAAGVVVIVAGGIKQDGFGICINPLRADLYKTLPKTLRDMADMLDAKFNDVEREGQ